MSEVIETVQKQDPGSEYIVLYDLEYTDGSFAHFFAGLDDDLTEIQFRDSGGTAQTYVAIPLEADGFDINSDGAYSRPEITIANIESVFSDEIGGIDYEDLIGQRVTRRTTLKKYLVGEPGDSTPPVEFPKIVYIIDRIKSKNIISVTFELASPFDLAGVRLPRRTIIGNACPWVYRGRTQTPSRGGCNWNQETVGSAAVAGGDPVYANAYDEYIVPSSITFSTVGASTTANDYYQTSINKTRISSDGTTSSVSITEYWQALTSQASSPTTPSDTDNINWRRVRIYYTYNSANTYYGYTDSKCNDYVLDSGKLWQVKRTTQDGGSHATLDEGVFWTEGDLCGKKVRSCKLRFNALVHPTVTGGVSINTNSAIALPFGGFPGATSKR